MKKITLVLMIMAISSTILAKPRAAPYPRIVSGTKTSSQFKWAHPGDEVLAKAMHQLTGKPFFTIYNERANREQTWPEIAKKFGTTQEDLEATFKKFRQSFKEEVKDKEKKFADASRVLKTDSKAWKKTEKAKTVKK